jgi:hypothetical protein
VDSVYDGGRGSFSSRDIVVVLGDGGRDKIVVYVVEMLQSSPVPLEQSPKLVPRTVPMFRCQHGGKLR